jgi:hypothetical protein
MKTIASLILSLFLSISFLTAQSQVDLRILQVSQQQSKACYDLEIRSPYHEQISLAGQNYRMFYNAKQAEVIEESIKNYSSRKSYGDLDVLSTEQNDIGFLSLSVDARVNNDHTVILPQDGSWVAVASACFNSISDDAYDLVWASQLTQDFASAQVALSKWDSDDEQVVIEPNLLIDYLSQDGRLTESAVDITVYPNPVADYINIKFDGQNDANTISITDGIGRQVAYESLNSQDQFSYDLSNWPSGRYTVDVLDSNGGVINSKSVIKTFDNQ